MKKYLPFIVLGLGIVVFVAAIFLIKVRGNKQSDTSGDEESNLVELELSERPVVSLTPTEDGHYLNLKITQIKIPDATTMDFQFLYDVPDKVQQGSSGDNIDITSGSFESELLLGSESSGKFRYDEGVETGSLMLWFRNKDKKLVTKLETTFHMLKNIEEIESPDGDFKYSPTNTKGIFIVMDTLGIPNGYDFNIENIKGPYGVFSPIDDEGTADIGKQNVFVNKGSWNKSNKGLGVYVATN